MRTIISDILPEYYTNSLLNKSNNETRYKFYPHLNFPLNNDRDFEARLNPVLFPSIDSIEASKWAYNNKYSGNSSTSSKFVIQLGGFVNIYKGLENHQIYDIIITCFFIDTAVDIYNYIYTIINILKVGGIWINAGPLHYHSHLSIKYSYKQIIEILEELGFNLIKHSSIEGSYCGDENISMKPEYYSIPIDIFRLEQIDDDDDDDEREVVHEKENNIWKSTNFQILK
jgi:carnosine N-methyltransferase